MRFSRTCVAIPLSLALAISVLSQQTAVERDANALAILQPSLAAMGGAFRSQIADFQLQGTSLSV